MSCKSCTTVLEYVDHLAADTPTGRTSVSNRLAAGQKYGIRPGCPNLIELIEAGLMTYGTDITRNDIPLEGSMAQYVGLDADIEAIGLDAIRARAKKGIDRAIVGITIDGDKVPANRAPWPVIAGGRQIGSVTSAVWSPRLQTNVSLG